GKAKLYIPSFVPKHFINKPKGSSHFSITLGIFGISDYYYNEDSGKYSKRNNAPDLWKVIKSEMFSVDQSRIPEQTLCVEIDITDKNVDNITFFAAVGITFWQKSDDNFYAISGSGSLILKTVSTNLVKEEKTKVTNSKNNNKSIEYFHWVDLNDLIREIYRNPEQPRYQTEYVLIE
ncbi:MAG: hypothetical protein Q8880_09140, partial [Bacteroidota bacterium]|nr:hypothetical protein [Bacteroidota bacterium]